MFYRSISQGYFFIFLISSIIAIAISGIVDFLGRKILIQISFAFIGLNFIFSSMFGYTILVSIFDGLVYGLLIAVGIFTYSGDIIVESNYKFKGVFISLFLGPFFLYDLLVGLFLYNVVQSDLINFGLYLTYSRNSFYSLVFGLYIVGLAIFNYSPETFPITRKQRFMIERYMMKAKKLADKYK